MRSHNLYLDHNTTVGVRSSGALPPNTHDRRHRDTVTEDLAGGTQVNGRRA
jgi:hypothetical protein